MKNNLDNILTFVTVTVTVTVTVVAATVAISAITTRTASDAKIRVIDGDSIAYGEQKLRLACIDAPEKGQAGWLFSKELLESKINNSSNLKIQQVGKDSYGRIVAIVVHQEKILNLEMLSDGGAMTFFDIKSHCKNDIEFFSMAEKNAREAQVGIWSPPAYPPISPSTFRKLKPFLK